MNKKYTLLGVLVEYWNQYDPSENHEFDQVVMKVPSIYLNNEVEFAIQELNKITDQYTRFSYSHTDDGFTVNVLLII